MARESTPARRSPKKLLTPTEREAMQFAAYAETYNACQTLRDIMAFAKNSLTAPLVAKSHTTLSEQTIAAANSGQHTQAVAIYYEVMQPKWQQLLKSGAMPRAVAHPMKLIYTSCSSFTPSQQLASTRSSRPFGKAALHAVLYELQKPVTKVAGWFIIKPAYACKTASFCHTCT